MGISIPVFGMVNMAQYTGISRYGNYNKVGHYKFLEVEVEINLIRDIKDCKGQQQQQQN